MYLKDTNAFKYYHQLYVFKVSYVFWIDNRNSFDYPLFMRSFKKFTRFLSQLVSLILGVMALALVLLYLGIKVQ